MITKTDQRPLSPNAELPPFPEGWYFVANRESILRKKLIEKTWMGQEVVAWCDDEGRICISDAICPHLGSHLGPTVGGKVRDGCLVCPFHGFEFDATGQCVATPHAPPPSGAKLNVYETAEILGMVFAWWGAAGRPSLWRLPDEPPAGAEWSKLRSCTLRFRGHPQETTENSAVGPRHTGRLDVVRSEAGQPNAQATQAGALRCRSPLSAGSPTPSAAELRDERAGEALRQAGCRHLGEETVQVSPPAVPRRRSHREVSPVLSAVLSGTRGGTQAETAGHLREGRRLRNQALAFRNLQPWRMRP